jgi:hypothetical protein
MDEELSLWTVEAPVKDGKLVPAGQRMLPRRWYVKVTSKDETLKTTAKLIFEVTGEDVRLAQIELASDAPHDVDESIIEHIPLTTIKQLSAKYFYLEEDKIGQRSLVIPPRGQGGKTMKEHLKAAELHEVATLYCREPTRGAFLVENGMGYGSRSTATARVKEARALGLIPAKDAPASKYYEKLLWLLDHNPDGSKRED